MKLLTFSGSLVAISCIVVLSLLAFFPLLRALSPRAPALVANENTKVLNLEKGQIRYESTGSGSDTVLFLHGFNNQLAAWDAVWPLLGECGRRIRIDIPGFGGSTWPSETYALPEQAARVISFMDKMALTRVTLVGVSMGGSLSAWIAAHYPERVKGLMLLAPSGFPGSLTHGTLFGKFLRPGLLNRLASRVADSGLYRHLYSDSRALQALTVTASYGEPWAEALKKIRTPTQILWSHGDIGVSFTFAEAVAQAIPGSTLVPLPAEVGHDIPANSFKLISELVCKMIVHNN